MWPKKMTYPQTQNITVGHNDSAKLGTGARFAALKSKIAKRGGVRDPGAVAAAIGREKYGKARFQKMAAKGRRGA